MFLSTIPFPNFGEAYFSFPLHVKILPLSSHVVLLWFFQTEAIRSAHNTETWAYHLMHTQWQNNAAVLLYSFPPNSLHFNSNTVLNITTLSSMLYDAVNLAVKPPRSLWPLLTSAIEPWQCHFFLTRLSPPSSLCDISQVKAGTALII